MSWEKITLRDEWASRTVHAGKLTMSAYGTNRSLEEQPPIIRAGQWITVLWPNGTEGDIKTGGRRVEGSYCDQGDRWNTVVYSTIPTIVINHNGCKMTVDLHKSGCKVWVE
jgi:hypothetical protein